MRQGEAVNIHESKLSDIHRPTLSRLPIGRLKSYKYKKSAYGGKKSPARAGKKGLAHRCYALHDNQDYTGGSKPHPSLPQGEGAPRNHVKHSKMELPPLGEGMGRGLHKQQQLCRSCDSPAQGCGRSTLPWVSTPTNLATL